MTNWTPDLEARAGPRYVAIADALAEDVSAGRFRPGDRLPTHRDLAWRLGVTVGTVSRAYAEAERRGLVSGEVGRGTYVRTAVPAEAQVMRPGTADEADFVDLNFNFPPAGGEDLVLGETLRDIAADPASAALLDYQHHAGLPAHRAAGADWLARHGLDVPAERIVITAGAQHGILTVLAAVARPGDRILAEAVTYPGLQLVARMLGLRLEGVTMDADGVIPEAFEAACRAHEVKALYCIPTLQNPTTATMPEDRRRAIAAVAARHGVAIVEDDLFRLMAPAAPPPIREFAPEHGYYVTSLSKSIAPGLRVGYVVGPEGATERLGAAVRSTCWMTPPVTVEIASRWVRDGTGIRVLEARRREAAARRARALEILDGHEVRAAPGSLHLWLVLPEPWRAVDFAAEARRRGVGITPSDAFIVGRQNMTHAVRICLGTATSRERLERALRVLESILAEGPSQGFGGLV